MTPLLLCAYKPRYLAVVLNWLRSVNVDQKYRIFAWDNGGAGTIISQAGLECYSMRHNVTQAVVNVGKALAMHHLVDVVGQAMPNADCYVCMDDDVIVDRDHLDALVAAARRPGLGMIAPRFHPFNSVTPSGGTVVCLDPCPVCAGPDGLPGDAGCARCGGLGRDLEGLRLRVYPKEDRTVQNMGRVAGTLFALSKAAIQKLPWAPYLYPILVHDDQKPAAYWAESATIVHNGHKPVVYWTEDATLDTELTSAGLMNGYLEGAQHTPVIHLPELNQDYMQWKLKARMTPPTSEFEGTDR